MVNGKRFLLYIVLAGAGLLTLLYWKLSSVMDHSNHEMMDHSKHMVSKHKLIDFI